jgi:spermidine synthase
MSAPYAVIPVGIIAIFLYLLTFLSARLGILKLKTHRSIWNILLLITFLVTATLGLYLAIQINYKIRSPLADRILVWHVDFGIGMAMIAIFHFLSHLEYYFRLLKGNRESNGSPETQEEILSTDSETFRKFTLPGFIPLIMLGFTTIITQIVLLREFLGVFYGNELIIGIILTVWMTITGIGTMAGRYSKRITNYGSFTALSLSLLAILPLITVFLLYYLRNIVYLPGSLINVFQIILSSVVLLAPFCLLSGFLFSYLSVRISKEHKINLVGESYAAESAGSILGGALMSFLLVFFLDTFEVLSILFLINVVMLLWIPGKKISRTFHISSIILSILLTVSVFVLHLDEISKSFIYQNQEIIYQRDTPHGNLCITRTGEQLNFYENNTLMFTSSEPVTNEEDVHYSMVQHENPGQVLLISGGISGVMKELLKYPVESIDYVEINPWIIKIGRKFTEELNDPRIHIILDDPRRYINRTDKTYDVIIINIPEPGTAQLNRYYTEEFYLDLKKRTDNQSIIGLSLPSTLNYISEEAAMLNSVIYKTLSAVYEHLLFIPGNKNYLLASDADLSMDIPGMIERKGIETVYVNSYYLDPWSMDARSKLIMENIDPEVSVNKDFTPIGYYLHLRLWMSQYDQKYWILIGIVILLMLIAIIRSNIISFGVLAGGFAASSLEILILMVFQAVYGYVYHFTGMIFTFFMTGLVAGVALYRQFFFRSTINQFILLQVCTGAYALLLPAIFWFIGRYSPGEASIAIFSLLTVIIAALTGMLFTAAVGILKVQTATLPSWVYGYDLFGSALGAFLISVMLIPLAGIFLSAALTGIFNLLAALLSFSFRSRYTN